MTKVRIHADGSCINNGSPDAVGGWACILTVADGVNYGYTREISGQIPQQNPKVTNQRMELIAAIKGLEELNRPCEVTIITDSRYVVDTMNKDWKRNHNNDLWYCLDLLCRIHTVTWQWTKGHDGDFNNERCDMIANAEAHKAKGEG
jgi:ribonuclease HI